jgi:hypothetical protein
MALHFGWGKELRAKLEEKDTKEEKEADKKPNMRENLI